MVKDHELESHPGINTSEHGIVRHGIGLFEMALSVSILEEGSQRPYKRSRTMNTLDLTPQSMVLFRHRVGRFGMGTFS